MGESLRVQPSLASDATIHNDAEIIGTQPLTIRTPEAPWSYAISLRLDTPGDSTSVAEAVVRVLRGSVAVSCTREDHRSLSDEITVRRSAEPVRLELLPDAEHGAYLLIRTGRKPGPATVEIHSLRSRRLTADELGDAAAVTTLQPTPRWSRYYGSAGESIGERLRVREYLRLTAPTRRPWLEGLSVMIEPRDQLSRALHVSGLYEPNTAIVLKRLLRPGAIFFDVGAHAGVFTMLGSRYVGASGRVFSFEPSPRERARLDQHVSINELTNVEVIPAAVGSHDGRAMLSVAAAEYGGLNTLGKRFAYDVERAETVEVDLTTLDSFVTRREIGRVDVMKLDIEGAECAAIDGATNVLRTLRPTLILEVVSAALRANGSTPEDLEQRLRTARYALYEIDEETATLKALPRLAGFDEQNVVALPAERSA